MSLSLTPTPFHFKFIFISSFSSFSRYLFILSTLNYFLLIGAPAKEEIWPYKAAIDGRCALRYAMLNSSCALLTGAPTKDLVAHNGAHQWSIAACDAGCTTNSKWVWDSLQYFLKPNVLCCFTFSFQRFSIVGGVCKWFFAVGGVLWCSYSDFGVVVVILVVSTISTLGIFLG